jgi:hypothetical protein
LCVSQLVTNPSEQATGTRHNAKPEANEKFRHDLAHEINPATANAIAATINNSDMATIIQAINRHPSRFQVDRIPCDPLRSTHPTTCKQP